MCAIPGAVWVARFAVADHVNGADPAQIEGDADVARLRVRSGEECRALSGCLVRRATGHDAARGAALSRPRTIGA
jgi:hypothetical protein